MLSIVNKELYEKSVREGLDDYSLIDYSIPKPKEKDYEIWNLSLIHI